MSDAPPNYPQWVPDNTHPVWRCHCGNQRSIVRPDPTGNRWGNSEIYFLCRYCLSSLSLPSVGFPTSENAEHYLSLFDTIFEMPQPHPFTYRVVDGRAEGNTPNGAETPQLEHGGSQPYAAPQMPSAHGNSVSDHGDGQSQDGIQLLEFPQYQGPVADNPQSQVQSAQGQGSMVSYPAVSYGAGNDQYQSQSSWFPQPAQALQQSQVPQYEESIASDSVANSGTGEPEYHYTQQPQLSQGREPVAGNTAVNQGAGRYQYQQPQPEAPRPSLAQLWEDLGGIGQLPEDLGLDAGNVNQTQSGPADNSIADRNANEHPAPANLDAQPSAYSTGVATTAQVQPTGTGAPIPEFAPGSMFPPLYVRPQTLYQAVGSQTYPGMPASLNAHRSQPGTPIQSGPQIENWPSATSSTAGAAAPSRGHGRDVAQSETSELSPAPSTIVDFYTKDSVKKEDDEETVVGDEGVNKNDNEAAHSSDHESEWQTEEENEGDEDQGSMYSPDDTDVNSEDSNPAIGFAESGGVVLLEQGFRVPSREEALREAGPTTGRARVISAHTAQDRDGNRMRFLVEQEIEDADLTMSGGLS
ncbi:hypothetical protein F4804DRAFT_328832 [Jackrogersella minutella]|nr:hypothetical protein F4804DRAFT_328832 [Jackrogersella minutella]